MNQPDMHYDAAIIGAGPAGLTAAYELTKKNKKCIVLEKGKQVGGISRTEDYKGYKIDIGGHRFFTKIDRVQEMWEEVLGEDFLLRPRMSRIYYKGKFFYYPIQLFDVIKKLGVLENIRIGFSFIASKLFPYQREDNLKQWVSNRFGKRLFFIFFKTYTEKVWGIPCDEIKAEWAAQRIKSLTLWRALKNALFPQKKGEITTLVDNFYYPKQGPGMLWERVAQLLAEKGNEARLESGVSKIILGKSRVNRIIINTGRETYEVTAKHFISSMPISQLILSMEPAPPENVVQAAKKLTYRDFLTVGLIVKQDNLFPDNWIYIHSPEVKVGRIQNYRNWSPFMVPYNKQDTSCIGLEYFCLEKDELWEKSNEDLIKMATKELDYLKLVDEKNILDGVVIRQPKAYPVYTGEYKAYLEIIKNYIDSIENLQTIGRNGLHKYNNQDHSMLTAMLAVENIENRETDIWEVNTERSYHEEVRIPN